MNDASWPSASVAAPSPDQPLSSAPAEVMRQIVEMCRLALATLSCTTSPATSSEPSGCGTMRRKVVAVVRPNGVDARL